MARSQLWKHQGGLAGHAHFLIHLKTSPHYGLFEIRGQGPRVGQPVSSEGCVVGGGGRDAWNPGQERASGRGGGI